MSENMARLEGIEPPTFRFEVYRSIRLSYRRVYLEVLPFFFRRTR